MPLVIGIDEAGYGPTLGPLVVTATAFDVADPDADLWETLADDVARTRRGAAGRLPVADSKVIYAGGRGLADLERTVLAFLAATGRTPRTLRELIAELCSDADDLCRSPWWRDYALPYAETAAAAPRPVRVRA